MKFKRGLVLGSFNPFHEGHLYLLKIAKENSDKTDIYIGTRQKPDRMPKEIRLESVKRIIENYNWETHFSILDTGKHTDIKTEKYDLFLTGSDLLNTLSKKYPPKMRKIQQAHNDFYLSFPNILSINRKENPLKAVTKKKLVERLRLIEYPEHTNASATKIRRAYREGKDISKMVSPSTWSIIKEYVYIFKN